MFIASLTVQGVHKAAAGLEALNILMPGSQFSRQAFAELIVCWICDVLY